MSALTFPNIAFAVAIGVFLGLFAYTCLITSLLVGWYLFDKWQAGHSIRRLHRDIRRALKAQEEHRLEQEGY